MSSVATPPGGRVGLMSEQLLEALAHESLPVSEAVVERCLDPMYVPDLAGREEMRATSLGLLRTGSVFVLNAADVSGAFESMWSAPDIPEFPPLPFTRIVIEGRDESGPCPLYTIGEEGDLVRADTLALGLIERERGSEWDFLTVYRMYGLTEALMRGREAPEELILGTGEVPDELIGHTLGEGRDDRLSIYAYRVTPAGVKQAPQPPGWQHWLSGLDDEARVKLEQILEESRAKFKFDHLVKLAVTAAHLITASQVRHSEITLPRAQRRDHRRRYRAPSPRVYFVDLAAAGEQRSGVSDREYHVRWLVRGHWRRSDGGRTFIASKGGMCTWVKPYVKGPIGAPWKGRPVHVAGPEETSDD